MIKFYYYLSLLAMLFINTTMQAQKIEGAGIPPSKVQAYSNESAQYSVSGMEGRLTWEVTNGRAGSPFGFSQTEITWGTTSEGKITVRNDKGKSVQATVQVAPPAPEFKGLYIFDVIMWSDVNDCTYYQWTAPSGCKIEDKTGTFRLEKYILPITGNVGANITSPKQLYYEGDIKVQAISNKNSLLSRVATYKYKKLDIQFLKSEGPLRIGCNDQKNYTFSTDYIEGATYNWRTSEATIISGQNTNKIIVKPYNSLGWYFHLYLDFTYHGITDTRTINTPIDLDLYIAGSTDVSNGIVNYSLESPYIDLPETGCFWRLDGVLNTNYPSTKYSINTDTLSPGVHILDATPLINFQKASINITKHSSASYIIRNISKKIIISKDEDINKVSLSNSNPIVQIFDQQGILILKQKIPNNIKELEINSNKIKNGIYFVTVIDGINKTTQKVIIR